jgi:hypothetical protein
MTDQVSHADARSLQSWQNLYDLAARYAKNPFFAIIVAFICVSQLRVKPVAKW